MKFKKIFVTGLAEKEMSSGYWSRIKKVTDKIEFSATTDNDLIPLLSDVECLFIKLSRKMGSTSYNKVK